jgi:hypothetical protein
MTTVPHHPFCGREILPVEQEVLCPGGCGCKVPKAAIDAVLAKRVTPTPSEAALLAARVACVWRYDPDGYWQTECSDQFCITEGSPAENRMRYCHYCGRRIMTNTEAGVIDSATLEQEK